MTKELIENLLIEFDEMGFEPTTLCDSQREVDSFRNRLKQVLEYLKAIDNAKPSEALEAFRDILGILSAVSGCEVDMDSERIKIVNQALQRLEAIDNAKPSEVLGKVAILAAELGTSKDMKFAETRFPRMLITIQQALLKSQEQEKVLEIIFEKNVMIEAILALNLHDYNDLVSTDEQLTPEESNIIKRYAECLKN